MKIDELIKQGIVKELMRNLHVPTKYQDDLEQEVYLILLERDYLSKLKDDEVKYFLVAVLKHQFYSKTSPFYFKYKRYNELASDLKDEY